MKKAIKGSLLGLAIALVFFAGIWVGTQREHTKETCITGDFFLPSPTASGFVIFGEQQLCGRDFRWSPAYGPDMEAWEKANK